MKKLLISLLFLFPVITHSATAQVSFLPGYRIEEFSSQRRCLNPTEKNFLDKIDPQGFIPEEYTYRPFYTLSEFTKEGYPERRILLLVIDNATHQWAGCVIFSKEASNTLYLNYLIVSPEHQRKGIGQMVIDYLFRQLMPEKIKLQAHEATVTYYTKLGFTNNPRYKNFDTNVSDSENQKQETRNWFFTTIRTCAQYCRQLILPNEQEDPYFHKENPYLREQS